MKAWKDSKIASVVVILAVILAVSGCKSDGLEDDPILRLSAEESLVTGKELMGREKYARAREYLTHAFEVEPNSASGREALLLAADTLFLQGGTDNLVRAEAKYRDFQNRFPTSERSGYVQFQIAHSLAKRMLRPDRDQSATHKALEAFEEVILLYPESEYASQAREQIGVVKSNLAESEYGKGHFNYRLGLYTAAIARLQRLQANYPDYEPMDQAWFFLGMSNVKLKRNGKALEAFGRLREDYPASDWIAKIPDVEPPPEVEPAEESAAGEGEAEGG